MYDLKPFWFWCQKVLPLVYDDSLSYYEVLCKIVDYMNKVIENNMEIMQAIAELGGDTALETDYVTPEMFGAVGDGLVDDTEALQKAIDSGKNVMLSMNKIYLIRNTIHLKAVSPEGRNRVSRAIFSRAKTGWNNPNSNISCSFANPDFPIFAIDAADWTFDNVNINCKNQATNEEDLTLLKTNRDVVDIDFHLINCRISNVSLIADFTGRGFQMSNCETSHMARIIEIKWKDEGGGIYHNAETGQRGIRIFNNRFHACTKANPLIHLISGYAYGLEFTGNIIDRGYSQFLYCEAPVYNWLIANNNITGMRGNSVPGSNASLMYFADDVKALVVANNYISQPGETGINFTNMICFAPNTEVVNAVITGNSIDTLFDGSMILLPKPADDVSARLRGCVISNNAIDLIDEMTSQRGILRGGVVTMERCAIIGNTINRVSTGNASIPYALYSAGNLTLNDCKVMGNALPGADVTVGNTGTRTLTRSLIDDDLFSAVSNDQDNTEAEPMIP